MIKYYLLLLLDDRIDSIECRKYEKKYLVIEKKIYIIME
jgi:hypothetical protein